MPRRHRNNHNKTSHSRKGNKAHLPSKSCAYCQKEFTWRKKWKTDRENVLYCSTKCKKLARLSGGSFE